MTELPSSHRIVQIRPFFLSLPPLPPPFWGGGSRAATIAYELVPVRFCGGNLVMLTQGKTPHLIKYVLQFVLRERRTLNVFDRTKVFRHPLTIFLTDWLHTLLGELVADARIVSKIGLSADNKTRDPRAVMMYLRKPFLPHVLKRSGGCY